MDIGAFSDDNFEAADWINTTFKSADQQQNKEVFVSTLVSKLQLYVQQVNSALEDTSQQVLASMPRIMKDAQNLQNEALSLREKMTEVQYDIAEVQKKTGACMENLERLDGLKTKLQIAKQGLQESDGWGRLTSELDDLLERSDIAKACEKLQCLQRSLAAQVGLPGQSEREAQVEGFKNRMEALASPAVVNSFSSGDIETSKKHVETFLIMERLPQLTHYYRTVQRGILQQQWTDTIELAINGGSTRFLREFYEYLIENWQKQYKWCVNVFGTVGAAEPISVIIELLPLLQPTRETAVTNCLKRSNDKLIILQEISSANIYFGNIMQRHIEALSIRPSNEQLNALATAIYDSFMVFVSQYAAMEQQHLSGSLNELILVHPTAAESVRAVGNANAKMLELSEEALSRCETITQNCGLPALVVVFNYIFKIFLDKYRKAQQQLHATQGTAQNWSLLQTCISLLHNVGDFKRLLDDLESKIIEKVLSKQEQIERNDDVYFGYKFIGKRESNDFKKLLEKVRAKQEKNYVADMPNADTNQNGIFGPVFDIIKPICEYIHDTTLASVFLPIENHLKSVVPPESLNSSAGDLPDYSVAPQEFITQIGQYLLTLPQHLEPLLLAPSTELKTALELCDDKYSRNVPSADILLSLLAEECCALYEERIGQICELSLSDSKQLATDIEYLASVLEELGLSLGAHLQQTAVLLRAPPENYLACSAGCDPKLVTGIRQLRNIISAE